MARRSTHSTAAPVRRTGAALALACAGAIAQIASDEGQLPAPTSSDEEARAVIEFLEFLGGFETARGEWLDPTTLDDEGTAIVEAATQVAE